MLPIYPSVTVVVNGGEPYNKNNDDDDDDDVCVQVSVMW